MLKTIESCISKKNYAYWNIKKESVEEESMSVNKKA